ncbi:hypothetical protein GCM10028787_12070 [Brachybacterium horti]|uniref:Muramidase n=1 Tax=Brachybacterium rhamnosum TaxID=173361 RepID=A0ABW4Q1S2_9MICO
MTVSRRHLLRAAPLGLAAVSVPTFAATALAAPSAPAEASDEWTEEFLTRAENREYFALDDMDDWQTDNARFVIAVCKGHGISAHGAQIVLATAIVEAWLYNYEPAVDLDSGGMFQQRPSMGWGTAEQVRHKKRAIDAFLGLGDHSEAPGLLDVAPDYESWDVGSAAQAVQASAFPERYQEQAEAAAAIWDRYQSEVDPYTD